MYCLNKILLSRTTILLVALFTLVPKCVYAQCSLTNESSVFDSFQPMEHLGSATTPLQEEHLGSPLDLQAQFVDKDNILGAPFGPPNAYGPCELCGEVYLKFPPGGVMPSHVCKSPIGDGISILLVLLGLYAVFAPNLLQRTLRKFFPRFSSYK